MLLSSRIFCIWLLTSFGTHLSIFRAQSFSWFFNIVCLVSDLPKEGTQAYSNNISLFQSLSPCLKVFYHYMPSTFELYLAEEYFVAIHFLSVEHIYSDSFLKTIPASQVSLYQNSIFLKSFSTCETLNIVLGFVPSSHLSSLPEGSIIFPPDISLSGLKNLLSLYISDFTCLQVNIFDALLVLPTLLQSLLSCLRCLSLYPSLPIYS